MNHTTSDSPPWAYQHFNSEEKERTCCKYFKILNGYEDIYSSRLCTLSSTGLRGHSLKLFKERSRLLLRKQTFTQCVVDSWNNLPENVVNVPSINAFKSRFNTHTRGVASKLCPTWYMPTIHIQRPQMRTRAN